MALRCLLHCWMLIVSVLASMTMEARGSIDPMAFPVRVLTLDGIVNPMSSRYIKREVTAAAHDKDLLIVLKLDTPGGLETSMREIVQTIFASTVPIVVYVAPEAARAASAGMFITIAGHVAAMSPGTNIGAAHPVALQQEGQDEQVTTQMKKAALDAAAFARSIAASRGRNAEWAQQAVLESVSITAQEAKDKNVIDLIARDLADLLNQLDGREVTVAGRQVVLRTKEAEIKNSDMNFAEKFLHTITDPNIAYLLMTVGVIGIIAELYNPGMLFPGISGVVALLLAFSALGSLPLSWAGLALLVIGIGLLVLELYVESGGILMAFGIVGFVLGSLFLYQPLTGGAPAMPNVEVNRWLVFSIAALLVAFFALILRAVLRSRRSPVTTGVQSLIGRGAVVTSPLAPTGRVRIEGEEWSAVQEEGTKGGPLQTVGEHVRVVGVRGVIVVVERILNTKEEGRG